MRPTPEQRPQAAQRETQPVSERAWDVSGACGGEYNAATYLELGLASVLLVTIASEFLHIMVLSESVSQ
jgi:hypothetical protein